MRSRDGYFLYLFMMTSELDVSQKTFKEKLNKIIDRYLKADTSRKQAGAKGAITKLVTQRASEVGADNARVEFWETLLSERRGKYSSIWKNWDSLLLRFRPGTLYQEGDRVMGWWDDGQVQVQANELPLVRSNSTYVVSFHLQPSRINVWQQRGFEVAEPLPLTFVYGSWAVSREVVGITVSFPVARSHFFAQHGYALPCQLQWHRDWSGLVVDRSIIEHGFWQAWKWWGEETKWWYLEHRPELFADMDWWGESKPVRYEPENDPYAAVLGGQM
jgi:hypothetical protein